MTSTPAKHDLLLPGCTADPLMMYLKALGVFRILAEQEEPDVRACWRNGVLTLHTALDREAMVTFFLDRYVPTPIVAPWNSRYKTGLRGDPESVTPIEKCTDQRLRDYRDVIALTRTITSDDKSRVLAECRNKLPDSVVPWLDAVYVLTADKPGYPPLLSAGGTVGTSGSGDLSMNHMKNLVLALGLVSGKRGDATVPGQWLWSALFGIGLPRLSGGTPGQFNPGGVGGPNATAGFEADSLTNPWDFVLMLEGALLFAGAAARRLAAESKARASFPFTVSPSAAGYGTESDLEYRTKSSRGETWLPLWDQPATYPEVAHVFAEARAQVATRQAETGSDFARAVAGLGVERGISEFIRVGFLQRSGKDGIIATPLGRFQVGDNPAVDLLVDVDGWLRRLGSDARREKAPEGLRRCLREVDRAIMDLARAHHTQSQTANARALQQVLVALGRAELWLARSSSKRRPRPLDGLRADWYYQADDGSPEFRIAAALASIQGAAQRRPVAAESEPLPAVRDNETHASATGSVAPIRANLEPVSLSRGGWQWANGNPSHVWLHGHLSANMAAVIMRRCMEARRAGLAVAPVKGKVSASLQDVRRFLEGRLDERHIAELVLPLSMLRWHDISDDTQRSGQQSTQVDLLLPLHYALIKLLFLPWRFRPHTQAEETTIGLEPEVLSLLNAGRGTEAYRIAYRRLRASGLNPLVREVTISEAGARRLCAALLIPVSYPAMYDLARLALSPPRDGDKND